MDERLTNLIIGTLLHDVGKIVYRTGVKQTHSQSGWEFLKTIEAFAKNDDIKDCVKFHHGRDLAKANLPEDSLAFISYLADNISAAGDRRADYIEGDNTNLFDRGLAFESVFNILKTKKDEQDNKRRFTYNFGMLDKINYPTERKKEYTTGNYNEILLKIKKHLQGIEIDEKYINSVLLLLESTISYIPSSTNTKELADISLYDHSKTSAAIASILYHYLKNESYKNRLFKNEKEFLKEEAFLLYTMDLSGIQNYIYTISGKEAVKSLRARSLYIEILLENIVDELLNKLGLSRCNLLYTGGGHAYLLLANTEETKDILLSFEEELKKWFLNNFDISLFIASGYAICTGKELAEEVGEVYKRVGKSIAIRKAQRYTAEDIIKLNSSENIREERECRECKRTGKVNEENKCENCQSLIDISPKIIKENTYFVIYKEEKYKNALKLPFGQVLVIEEKNEIQKDYLRIYSKNTPSMGDNLATNLWVGDYSTKNELANRVKTFEELAQAGKGINRIAILRADVDDLGRAFTSGFKNEQGEKYQTISRTSTLSRQLSMFFKYHINSILKDYDRNALIIYSGGDDMFIVGSWDEIIDLAKDIRDAFAKYTQNTLTISAGIGIFTPTFPIARIAEDVGELEKAAKTKTEAKNKVTLFRKGKMDETGKVIEEDWVLDWHQLPQINSTKDEIGGIEEKIHELRKAFGQDDKQGKAFLYKILDFLRDSDKDKINIARYAYLLKRASERNRRLDVPSFYKYILDPIERKELEIAITLYSYETRK